MKTSTTKAHGGPLLTQYKVIGLMRGMYSRIAERLGVDRSFVSRVANGSRRSERIEAELQKELGNIERLIAKEKRILRGRG